MNVLKICASSWSLAKVIISNTMQKFENNLKMAQSGGTLETLMIFITLANQTDKTP